MAEQPARPKGTPRKWTDDDLDAMSQVGPRDESEADAWWREHAPPGFKNLLSAEPDENDG